MYAIEMMDSVSAPRTVEWENDLTVANVLEARAEIMTALQCEASALRLDLRKVARVDMAGLQLVWSVVQTVGAQERPFVVSAGPALIECAKRAGFAPFWAEDSHVG